MVQLDAIMRMLERDPALKTELLKRLGVSKTGRVHNKYPPGTFELRRSLVASGEPKEEILKFVLAFCKEKGFEVDPDKLRQTIQAELSYFKVNGNFDRYGTQTKERT